MSMVHIIPILSQISESLSLAEEFGAAFEYNDFFMPDILDDHEAVKKRIHSYKQMSRDRSKDTLHGAFLDVTVSSQDKKIREISEMRICQSMDAAAELGVKAVIVHTNYIAGFLNDFYISQWLDSNEQFFRKVIEEYKGISIYMENMWDRNPDLLAKLAESMKDTDFGVCFDLAHASMHSCPMERWFDVLSPYIRHMHINDNDGIKDLHETIGSGKTDWNLYQNIIHEKKLEPGVLIEINNIEKQRDSLNFLKQHKYYPFD